MRFKSLIIISLLPLWVGFSLNTSPRSAEHPANGWLSWVVSPPYPEHIAGAFTGGFGEPSCHSCHFDYDINMSEGELIVTGPGSSFEAGKTYEIEVTVKRPEIGKAGFQMTARYADGGQAGKFMLTDEVTLTPGIAGEVDYVQHAVGNVVPENGEKKWRVMWTAPESPSAGQIKFNIAANAANGDASEFGDWIYVEEAVLQQD